MTLNIISEVNYNYFDYKLRQDYPTYLGFVINEGYINLQFSDDDTQYQTAIISFHDGLTINDNLENTKHVKIYKYIDNGNYNELYSPIKHNYITGLMIRLHPKRTMVKGEVKNVKWYSDEELTDLILNIDIIYTRDVLGFALDRITIRTWINEDESNNDKNKISKKLYTTNLNDQIKEGIRRRENIINELKITVLGMMIQTITTSGISETDIVIMGRDFMKTHQTNFNAFISESNTDILQEIIISTDDWLDNVIAATSTTIRDYILSEMTI